MEQSHRNLVNALTIVGVLLFLVWTGIMGSIAYAEGPTIQQIKQAAPNESFLAFLTKVPASFDAQIMYALVLSGLVGAVGSYVYKWANGVTDANLADYFFRKNWKRSVSAGIAFFTTILGGSAFGVFLNDGQFVGWTNVLWIGVTTAFTVDATVNKAERTQQMSRASDATDSTIPPTPQQPTKE